MDRDRSRYVRRYRETDREKERQMLLDFVAVCIVLGVLITARGGHVRTADVGRLLHYACS
jgi:hypothetical protein